MGKKIFYRSNKIANLILNNNIVAVPTETVFGLFAQINKENKKKINLIKERSENQQIQISFPNLETMYKWVNITEYQKSILESELPGDKSFILPTSTFGKKMINDDTILVRIPSIINAKMIYKILQFTGPLYSTSANLHKLPILSNHNEIDLALPNVDYIVRYKVMHSSKASQIFSLLDDEVKLIRG